MAWPLHQPAVTAPIVGPRTQEKIDAAVRALDVDLDDKPLACLDEIVPGYRTAPERYAALHGLDWAITIPLIAGSVPGTLLGSLIAPRVPQSSIRRGTVVVLTMSGVALLDKAGWAPFWAGEDDAHPMLIGVVGLVMVVVPLT